jgi:cold shock protein
MAPGRRGRPGAIVRLPAEVARRVFAVQRRRPSPYAARYWRGAGEWSSVFGAVDERAALLAHGAQAAIAFPRFSKFPLQSPPSHSAPLHGTIGCAPRAHPASSPKEHAMPTGVVKWFNETKGFGFIKPDDGGSDVFAHYSGIKSKGFRTLKENQKVEYQVQQGQKGPQAVEIVPLS